MENESIETKRAIFFRDRLKQGRAKAFEDAEGFQEIIFTIEKLGVYLSKEIKGGLAGYCDYIKHLAEKSPLYQIQEGLPANFREIFQLVREARNEAFHQGAFARHLSNNAVQLALILEDALMNNENYVDAFMVKEIVYAQTWQPISFIREQMLRNSYTYLPIHTYDENKKEWTLISDYQIACYLRPGNDGNRKDRLKKTLEETISENLITPEPATTRPSGTSVGEANKCSKGKPVLITVKDNPKNLMGIVMPFDLL
jgi:hypothetical protein